MSVKGNGRAGGRLSLPIEVCSLMDRGAWAGCAVTLQHQALSLMARIRSPEVDGVSDVFNMITHIRYEPSEWERHAIAENFMVSRAEVPSVLTGGVHAPSWNGVVFSERVAGQRIALHATSRARLTAAMRMARDSQLEKAA